MLSRPRPGTAPAPPPGNGCKAARSPGIGAGRPPGAGQLPGMATAGSSARQPHSGMGAEPPRAAQPPGMGAEPPSGRDSPPPTPSGMECSGARCKATRYGGPGARQPPSPGLVQEQGRPGPVLGGRC